MSNPIRIPRNQYTFSHVDDPEDAGSTRLSFTFHCDGITEVGEEVKRFLAAVGFHPDNIKELFGEEVGE